MLITSLAEETSSLVAMEAAASATPVVAFRKGAHAEVVREGVTGFLVEDVAQAVLALQNISSISSETCVQHAQKNFSAVKWLKDIPHSMTDLPILRRPPVCSRDGLGLLS